MLRKTISGDNSLLKTMNKSTLLHMIRKEGPVSRASLARMARLTRATVSTLVEELIGDHLVKETGTGESSGGRKPVLLTINGEAGYVVGIDLRATDMLYMMADLSGEPLCKEAVPYRDGTDLNRTADQIAGLIRGLQKKGSRTQLGLVGVGIGIHGFVEGRTEKVRFAPFFGWKDADLKTMLENRLRVPVYVDNEANLAALGEWEKGVARGFSDVLYFSVGAGIGAGMILNGNLFRGPGGLAGEVGHTSIEKNGKACTCGNRGCWERYASEKAFAEQLNLQYTPGVTENLLRRLRQKSPEAMEAAVQIGECLGVGIGNMIHIFNPELVVIGNPIGYYAEWIHPHVQKVLENRYPLLQDQKVKLAYSSLDDEACAWGAAILGIHKMMQEYPQPQQS